MNAPFTRQRSIPTTLDEAERTVSAVVSTPTPLAMPAYNNPSGSGLPWREVLHADAADFSRFAMAPFLAKHLSTDVADQIGAVTAYEAQPDGSLTATVKFGASDVAGRVLADIAAGVGPGVSLGYAVAGYSGPQDIGDGGPDVFTATAWQPLEVTATPLPADPATGFRSLAIRPPATGEDAPADRQFMAELVAQFPNAGLQPSQERILMSRASTPTDQETLTRREARALVFDAVAEAHRTGATRTVPAHPTDMGGERSRQLIDGLAEALASRVTGASLGEGARAYRGIPMPEAAKLLLQANPAARAEHTRGGWASASVTIGRAMHTTSDFPILLGSVTRRILDDSYQRAPVAIKQVVRLRTDVPDFRAVTVARLAGISTLAQVAESGEVTASTASEAGESYSVKSWARLFPISRQALINDDLSAFEPLRVMGGAVGETEGAALVALLALNGNAGPTLADGNPWLRTAANNLSAAGTTLDEANLGAAITSMRGQRDAGGNLVATQPAYLLVGAEMEMAARRVLASITPATVATVNPITDFKIELVVEPRLTGKQWYVFSNPAAAATLELAMLAGMTGPTVESFQDPAFLGATFRVVHDFGVGAIGRAGVWRNPGA